MTRTRLIAPTSSTDDISLAAVNSNALRHMARTAAGIICLGSDGTALNYSREHTERMAATTPGAQQ